MKRIWVGENGEKRIWIGSTTGHEAYENSTLHEQRITTGKRITLKAEVLAWRVV